MKKFFAVLISLVLVFSMSAVAFAEDTTTPATGTITINGIAGEEYTIYKMFSFEPSVDGKTGRYNPETGWDAFYAEGGPGAAYLAYDADAGTIKWNGATNSETGEPDADAVAALAKAAVAYAENLEGVISATETADADGKATFTNLELGYYAIDTSLGTICALTTTNKEATVNEKNGQPKVEKKIVEDTLVDANNVAIGDTVNYQATITAGKGTVNYVLHDTMSAGLTFKADSVVVKKGDATLTAGKDYTLSTSCADGCTFEIDLGEDYEKTLNEGDTIVVTYSAVLEGDEVVIGNTGNPNTITLTYGNAQKTTEDTVITYTTELVIDKIEIVDGTELALNGAGFTLYKDSVAEGNKIGNEITGVTTFTWTGLEEGKYILVETTTPAGYNTIKNIEFTITCTEPTKVDAATDTATWSTTSTTISAVDGGTFYGKIENKTGSLLPETGGIGTTIFYIVGITLMLGAVILLITKKRVAAKAE